jgi:hypothetical protein
MPNMRIKKAISALIVSLLVLPNFHFQKAEAASYFQDESDIITRAEWGATDVYLYQETNDTAPDLVDEDRSSSSTNTNERKIVKVTSYDSNGKELKWPLQYPDKVDKFIIHHTATESDLDDPKQAIRNIYYYHAVTRGWGDIGYNYIIDQQGRVYEGRQGGEGVVGGHAGPGNIGSIGIAILGNYDDTDVPEAAVESLARLIAIKSKIHNITPSSETMLGHYQVMDTRCPGTYLKSKTPLITSMAKSMMTEDKEKFVTDYDFIDKSSTFYLEMDPNETETVTLKLQNTGKLTWDNTTYLTVNKNETNDAVVEYPEKVGLKLAKMNESSVKPGNTATFKFKIKAKQKSGLVYLNLTPVINSQKKPNDYKVLPVKVNYPQMTYTIVESNLPPSTIKKGEIFKGSIKLKNTGNIEWTQLGENKVYITLDGVMVGRLKEKIVKKNGVGTFSLTIPAKKSGYFENELFVTSKNGFDLVGKSILYKTLIFEEGTHAEILSKSESMNFEKGRSYIVWIKLRNIGSQEWKKEDLKVNFSAEEGVELTNQNVLRTTTKPGETVEIDLSVKIKDTAQIGGNKIMTISMLNLDPIKVSYVVTEGKSAREEIKAAYEEVYAHSMDIVVAPEDLAAKNGGKVRVRISFFSKPEITSDRDFYLYKGSEKLKDLKAGTVVTLTKQGTTYKAKISSTDETISSTTPLQVVAKDGYALEIKNFSRTSNWDSSYNDNKFRGALEARYIDGKYAVINELYLEDYLKGLAEEPNGEEFEKIKAIMVAARSYAKFYMHYAEKFPGMPYDMDDDPAKCQKYLGYGYEQRAPNVAKAVDETKGEVVTYMGELIKTPYFSSDAGKTKSAKEVWDWDAPYLISVDDPYCKGNTLSGHGVGMSGCGSKGMAEAGKTYKEILKYYYTETEITKLWE